MQWAEQSPSPTGLLSLERTHNMDEHNSQLIQDVAGLKMVYPMIERRVESIERQMNERMVKFEMHQEQQLELIRNLSDTFSGKLNTTQTQVITIANDVALITGSLKAKNETNSIWRGFLMNLPSILLSMATLGLLIAKLGL